MTRSSTAVLSALGALTLSGCPWKKCPEPVTCPDPVVCPPAVELNWGDYGLILGALHPSFGLGSTQLNPGSGSIIDMGNPTIEAGKASAQLSGTFTMESWFVTNTTVFDSAPGIEVKWTSINPASPFPPGSTEVRDPPDEAALGFGVNTMFEYKTFPSLPLNPPPPPPPPGTTAKEYDVWTVQGTTVTQSGRLYRQIRPGVTPPQWLDTWVLWPEFKSPEPAPTEIKMRVIPASGIPAPSVAAFYESQASHCPTGAPCKVTTVPMNWTARYPG